jgi:Family of unknown function (DUF6529)
MATQAVQAPRARRRGRLVAYLLLGAVVALGLGVYGRVHDPTGRSLVTLFFTGTINLKAWLATTAFALALFQLVSALWMYGKIGSGHPPKWLGYAHRTSGTLAFLFAIPVAYHCLWALGFHGDEGTRILVHGLAGCFFFGALFAKVLVVRTKRLPGWALPVLGGSVFTALTVIWLTSAFWFFTNVSFPGF